MCMYIFLKSISSSHPRKFYISSNILFAFYTRPAILILSSWLWKLQTDATIQVIVGKTFEDLVLNSPKNVLLEVWFYYHLLSASLLLNFELPLSSSRIAKHPVLIFSSSMLYLLSMLPHWIECAVFWTTQFP